MGLVTLEEDLLGGLEMDLPQEGDQVVVPLTLDEDQVVVPWTLDEDLELQEVQDEEVDQVVLLPIGIYNIRLYTCLQLHSVS